MLHNIRIVLVETSHTGNMGSTARAMKTMGLTNLYLVNPLIKPDSQAIALAAGASDVIGNATIVDTLDDAIAGCSLVVGTSARSRTLPWPMLEPRECGIRAVHEGEHAPVALVFGRERVGLTNDELQKCHYHVAIPANPDYSSLNLAMAVQILAYEVRVAYLDRQQVRRAAAGRNAVSVGGRPGTFLSASGTNSAAQWLYPPLSSGAGYEPFASFIHPRAAGSSRAEYSARYADVDRETGQTSR